MFYHPENRRLVRKNICSALEKRCPAMVGTIEIDFGALYRTIVLIFIDLAMDSLKHTAGNVHAKKTLTLKEWMCLFLYQIL